jgi:ubiquinone/menaquinone biosynthesis C-methylase UbiE
MTNWKKSWGKKILFIETYKINFLLKKFLWKVLKITLPKLKDQEDYWKGRGQVYREEFFDSGYVDREIFFQDQFIKILKDLEFDSILELGCGFGWNLNRIKKELNVNISGIDFSNTQLDNAKIFLENDSKIDLKQGNIAKLPYKDNSIDILFSFGVFMNLHKDLVNEAIDEAIRVSKRHIIHVEPVNEFYTKKLLENRIFKTNIISHNYINLYKERGLKLEKFLSYKDLENDHSMFLEKIKSSFKRWEPMEDCSKYTYSVFSK